MKPILFILKMPFTEGSEENWFCTHCAMIEGALNVNPDWEKHIDVRRIDHQKPRKELIEVLGEENQWTPVLVIKDQQPITDPVEITEYLSQKYGGARPHP